MKQAINNSKKAYSHAIYPLLEPSAVASRLGSPCFPCNRGKPVSYDEERVPRFSSLNLGSHSAQELLVSDQCRRGCASFILTTLAATAKGRRRRTPLLLRQACEGRIRRRRVLSEGVSGCRLRILSGSPHDNKAAARLQL